MAVEPGGRGDFLAAEVFGDGLEGEVFGFLCVEEDAAVGGESGCYGLLLFEHVSFRGNCW